MGADERECVLPVGVRDEAGRWRRRATIRKMRGHEEALLYDAALSSGKLITAQVANCVAALDGEGGDDAGRHQAMHVSAEPQLPALLEIRRCSPSATGSPCGYVCPACGTEVSTLEDLSQIAVRRLEGDPPPKPAKVLLADGYRDRDGVAANGRFVCGLPRGDDEEFSVRNRRTRSATRPGRADLALRRNLRESSARGARSLWRQDPSRSDAWRPKRHLSGA